MKKKTIILIAAACTVLLVSVILYANSFSILLWKNGFSNRDVYQQVSLKNDSCIETVVLAANRERFGILSMHQNAVGIWNQDVGSMVVDQNTTTTNIAVFGSSRFNFYYTSNTSFDRFLAGIVDQKDKIYSVPQQPDCSYSADLYLLPAPDTRFLVLYHLTSNDAKSINKTEDSIRQKVPFQKLK